jgi:hypothetical protein
MTIKISFKKNIQETLIEGKSDRRYGKDKNTPPDAEEDEKAKAKRDRRHKDKQDLKQKLKRENSKLESSHLKEKLKELIIKELTDYYGTESAYSLPKKQKRTGASESPLDKAERAFIDAAIQKKFKTLEYKEGKLLKQRLKKMIDDVIADELESFSPTPLEEAEKGT